MIERRFFLSLLIVVTLSFLWTALPFLGAILWAIIAAILFMPLNDRFTRTMSGRANLAAALTLLVILLIVVVPATLLGAVLLQEIVGLYNRLQSRSIDVGRLFQQVSDALPAWASGLLRRLGLTDFAVIRDRLGASVASSFQGLALRALALGQSAFEFVLSLGVMLYLTYFLLRDGKSLATTFERALPLQNEQRRALMATFATVIRATIKGSLVVAVVQGAIGAATFWVLGIQSALLWGVSMALLALLPVVGTGLIWIPVAVYLLATGAVWQGIMLVLSGVLLLGMVDNVLRPILVGRDVKMPDFLVLISTLGGLAAFGFNGFVIGPAIAAMFVASWKIFTASRVSEAATPPC